LSKSIIIITLGNQVHVLFLEISVNSKYLCLNTDGHVEPPAELSKLISSFVTTFNGTFNSGKVIKDSIT
jgi:hypothetical protein